MKITIISTLLLVIGTMFSVNAQSSANVAMIADIDGLGEINVDGENTAADILDELASGSQLSIKSGSKLTLFFFASSEEYTYDGPADILIEEQQPKLLSGNKANTRNLNMAKLADIASEDEGSIGLGVLKLRNFEKPKLQLLAPVDTKVIETHPKFSWSSVEGATTYEFILSNELGKKVANMSVSGNWVELPEDIRLMSDEEYTWEIIAQTSAATEYRAHAYFSVAEENVRRQVKTSQPGLKASFSEKVVYARLLEKLGLKQDAKTIWQELVALKPNSALLKMRGNNKSNAEK